jgi:predicted aconitase
MTRSDLQALATSMLTSESVLLAHYIKVNPQEQYKQAQEKLDQVLGKRQRNEDEQEGD